MRTLGALIDRLTIVNMKIWHLQDWVHRASRQSSRQFEEQNDLAGVQKKLATIGDLNKERNRVMDEIDELFSQSVSSGQVPREDRTKM